jgi:hypothetical protein
MGGECAKFTQTQRDVLYDNFLAQTGIVVDWHRNSTRAHAARSTAKLSKAEKEYGPPAADAAKPSSATFTVPVATRKLQLPIESSLANAICKLFKQPGFGCSKKDKRLVEEW